MNVIRFPRTVIAEPKPSEALVALGDVALALQDACEAIAKGPGSELERLRAINELHCCLVGVARVVESYRAAASRQTEHQTNAEGSLVGRLMRSWAWIQR